MTSAGAARPRGVKKERNSLLAKPEGIAVGKSSVSPCGHEESHCGQWLLGREKVPDTFPPGEELETWPERGNS